MRITIKEVTKTNIKFTLQSNVSFANSLRRILLGEVPGTAIDVVEIRENRTVLPDEMIAHRLGLVPISYLGTLIPKKSCSCDGFCEECSITFHLKKSNNTDLPISVTGQDLHTETPGVSIHNTLLLKLAPRQKIDITCIAITESPKNHVKFCPVSSIAFNYDPRNKTRETRLWEEQDVKKEWPLINQSDEVEWKEITEVEMNVECVEGMGKPREILQQAIEVYRTKMISALDEVISN